MILSRIVISQEQLRVPGLPTVWRASIEREGTTLRVANISGNTPTEALERLLNELLAESLDAVQQADDNPLNRLTLTMHEHRCHPDYEYTTTRNPRKGHKMHPVGEGWEPNVWRVGLGNTLDPNSAFERFEIHEEYYWRRRRK